MTEQLPGKSSSPPRPRRRASSITKAQLKLAELTAMVKTAEALADLVSIANEMVKRGESPTIVAALRELTDELARTATVAREQIERPTHLPRTE